MQMAWDQLKECHLCPRECAVDRLSGETGVCQTGNQAVVSSFSPHYGEEDPLVGKNGSGTIFFSGCSLLCVFCQNYDISHQLDGDTFSSDALANTMLSLQHIGCHNINFVTPSHVVPHILVGLNLAIEGGLRIPLVYNSSGYDKVETLALLDGIVDIYMPDFKFWEETVADEVCQAPDYPHVARAAIKEMHRQVGDLVTDENGIARRGLLIRHLVLPEGMAGTRDVMRFLAQKVSPNSYVNIMAQYRPCGRSLEVSSLGRRITNKEYDDAVTTALKEGITRLDERKRTFMLQWL